MAQTRPLVPTHDPQPFTDEHGLRRYHKNGGDYITIQNLKDGNIFAVHGSVWAELGQDIKRLPPEWHSYHHVEVWEL